MNLRHVWRDMQSAHPNFPRFKPLKSLTMRGSAAIPYSTLLLGSRDASVLMCQFFFLDCLCQVLPPPNNAYSSTATTSASDRVAIAHSFQNLRCTDGDTASLQQNQIIRHEIRNTCDGAVEVFLSGIQLYLVTGQRHVNTSSRVS
eukprot:Blabericola_migrator_1__1622@NODE_1434_length_4553_cov_5_965002_g953_i0_p1_GENE_NODE_1434_length_4553_cov_5_965002_g953_i0NODE_1434_length_4553_cov_5_965002_g953_i0_p1_ORF_typecomplete_len145_score10_27_NODE_1434_length_4553_cov_5_965002_g953_i0287721